MRPGFRILAASSASALLLFIACGLGPEAWEPHVLRVFFTKNGAPGEISLDQTGPSIPGDAGDRISLDRFSVQLYPTRRTDDGSRIVRVKELPDVPHQALSLEYRIVATLRRWEESGPCYDVRRQVETPWEQVKAERWQATPHRRIWELSDEIDEIRINVELRDPSATYTINKIDITPSTTAKRLRNNSRKSIFLRVFEAFRGERNCED